MSINQIAAIVTTLPLLALGQTFLYGSTTTALTTTAATLSAQAAHAQSAADYFERGETKENSGNHQGAIDDYSKAIEIDPKIAIYYYNRASAYASNKNYKKAVDDWNMFLTFDLPGEVVAIALVLRGETFLRLGNYKAADNDLSRAIEIDPLRGGPYFLRGTAHKLIDGGTLLASDYREDACNDYKKAFDLGYKRAERQITLYCTSESTKASSINQLARAVTVRIEGATQGSGVLVKRDGNHYTILTAWHVVEDNRPGEELAIYTPDGKEHQLEQGSIQRLGEIDMATINFNSNINYKISVIGEIKDVKERNQIFVSGFPLSKTNQLQFTAGEVVANAEVGIEQGYQLLYSSPTLPGMSGGPLLDLNSELVGIHGRGERDESAVYVNEIPVKTGVNQGIPISHYNFAIGASPSINSQSNPRTVDDYKALIKSNVNPLYQSTRWKTVERLSEQLLRINEDPDGYFWLANAKAIRGDHKLAIFNFTKYIDSNNRANDDLLPMAYSVRGFSQGYINEYQAAILDYNKAIELRPDSWMNHFSRGRQKMLSGDAIGAISDFNTSLRLNNQSAITYINLGFALTILGKLEEANVNYDYAYKLDPSNANALSVRAYNKFNLKDYKSAIMDYDRALKIDSNSYENYVMRGRSQMAIKNYGEAIRDHTKAIEIDPKDPDGFFYRALAIIASSTDNDNLTNKHRARICEDMNKASLLGNKDAIRLISNELSFCRM